jgi:hypothetical protein
MKLINFPLVKKRNMKKGKILSRNFFDKFAYYGLDMEPEPEP